MATTELIKTQVTYAAAEYYCAWQSLVFDRGQLEAAAGALYTSLKKWGLTPSGVKGVEPRSAADPIATFEIETGKYRVSLARSGLSVFVQWVDWEQAPKVQGMIQACLGAIAGLPVGIAKQSLEVVIQAVPDSDKGTQITLALAPPAVLAAGQVNCLGMVLYTDDGRSFVVDRSSVNPHGLYFKIRHEFGREAVVTEMFEKLRADQLWLAGLYCLEF